jgi:hypothetical protein
MTLPYERTSAVLHTEEFLRKLSHPYEGYKRIPKEVRDTARRLLRHYPRPFELRGIDNDVFSPSPEAYWSCNKSSTSES